MMMWLPACRIRTKPCAAKMRQISAGGNGRSLGLHFAHNKKWNTDAFFL